MKLYLIFSNIGNILQFFEYSLWKNINCGSGLILTTILQIFSVILAISMPKEQRAEIVKIVLKNDEENEDALYDAVNEGFIEEENTFD